MQAHPLLEASEERMQAASHSSTPLFWGLSTRENQRVLQAITTVNNADEPTEVTRKARSDAAPRPASGFLCGCTGSGSLASVAPPDDENDDDAIDLGSACVPCRKPRSLG